MISQGTFDATIILVAIVFFFLGAWLYRLLLWYPRGRKPLTGSHTLNGDGTINHETVIKSTNFPWPDIPVIFHVTP